MAPAIDSLAADDVGRNAELNRLLDETVMVANTLPRNADNTRDHVTAVDEEEIEIEIDLAHAELAGGYFQNTCVYESDDVRGMHMMSIYVKIFRIMGHDDEEIAETLIEQAGEDGPDVAQLIDFGGLDSIGRFICRDYMQAMLERGMSESTLRDYINVPIGPTATSIAAIF